VVRVRRKVGIYARRIPGLGIARRYLPTGGLDREIRRRSESEVLVGGNVIADGSQTDDHKEECMQLGGAIIFPRTKGRILTEGAEDGNEGMQSSITNGLPSAQVWNEDVVPGDWRHVRSERSGAVARMSRGGDKKKEEKKGARAH